MYYVQCLRERQGRYGRIEDGEEEGTYIRGSSR